METHNYCDDVGAIGVTGTVVKFDLMVHSATEQEAGGKPKLVLQQRVVMPLEGFVRAAARMQAVLQDLEKKGIITRQAREEAKSGKN